MNRSRLIFSAAVIAASFYVFAYPLMRLSTWAGEEWAVGWPVSMLIWIVGFLALRFAFSAERVVFRYLVVHWMGISFVFATVVTVYEMVRMLLPGHDAGAVPWIIGSSVLLVIIAIIASHHLQVRRIEIRSTKLQQPLRIVQISDVHIGSRQGGFMARIVRRINALQPDYVVITGDLIDTSAVEIDALQALADLEAKTFFSVGNHERYADLPKAMQMLDSLGVISLRQRLQVEQGVQFVGIDDAENPNQVAEQLPLIDLPGGRFTVLLYHRPLGWEAAIEQGIDLMLSGHTHNGQIFPFNLLVRQQFRRIRGLYSDADAHLYVSTGTGTWGPMMRLGSLNEISCFDLIPQADPGVREAESR